MKILLFALTAVAAFAQNDVTESDKPETNAYTTIIHWTAGVADYICKTPARQAVSTITVSTISNANPGVATAASHGLYFNASGIAVKALVYISGATGGWTGINGLHIATPTSSGAFSINVDTSGFGSFSGQSITVTTRAPLITNPVWAVKEILGDASGNPVYEAWTVDTTVGTASNPSTATTKFGFTCTAPSSFQ